jgi:O-antigen/teichoic acid export membrane protein
LLVFNTAVSIWIPVTIFISISSVISLAYLFKEVSLTSDIYPKSELIREYISHVLHTALLGLTSILHRDFIFIAMSLYLSPISAGLFSLSLILADSCRWALSGINQIFPSIATKLYENGSMNELNKLYQSTSKIATVISCVPVIIVSAYHKEIMTIFSPQYANHSIVLLVAVIAQVSATVVGSVGLLLLMTDNERLSLYVNITNAVLVVPVSIYLASKFGVFGLSVAFLLTMVYNNMAELIALYHSEELMPLTRDHLYILILTALLSITSIIVKSTMGRYTGFLFCLALAAVLGVFCYRYLLDSYEKEALQNVSLLT